jgi:hypothetical protein
LAESSVNSKFRLLGGGAPSDKVPFPLSARTHAEQTTPTAPATPPPPAPIQAEPAPPAPSQPELSQAEPIFLSDSADGWDLLNTAEIVQPLAQLCATREVQTPFLAAIAGPTGAGKTFALRRVAKAIEQLRASPGASKGGALSRVVLAYVDAASSLEAPVAIAGAAYAALDREPGGADYSGLLDEIGHAGGDPLRAARAASDHHDDLVRKLEAERSQRDDLEARRARLADALLFETAGSRVDGFVRANRGTIEACLRRFGLGGSDAGASFRSLVRDMASLGVSSRSAVVIRSIWGYPSQARLLFWAIVAFALAFGATLLRGEKAIAAIGLNGSLKPVADWIQAHGDWFDRASDVLFVVGALAIALNLWRALTFSNLLMRGARLLNHEARERRHDLETRATRLNQHVAALTTEVEAAAKRAESASRRAGGKTSARAPGPEFLEAGHGPTGAARAFLVALASRIGQASAAGPTPDRLIFVIDNLDALPPAAAIGWIDAAQNVIGRGCVGLLAFDPTRLAGALGGPHKARRRLGKWLQVALNLPARHGDDAERVVARLLSTAGQTAPALDSKVAAALVEPLSREETALLSALAPLAAHSPRDAKHFLNAYRLARCSNLPRPVMALMQAVAFADDDSQAAMRGRLANESGDLADVSGPAALVSAVKAARAANNGAISIAEARAAADIARRYAPLP